MKWFDIKEKSIYLHVRKERSIHIESLKNNRIRFTS